MPLLNEGTDVWRPVEATRLATGYYRIDGEVLSDEQWAFPPGTVVRCEWKTLSGGEEGLVAVCALP